MQRMLYLFSLLAGVSAIAACGSDDNGPGEGAAGSAGSGGAGDPPEESPFTLGEPSSETREVLQEIVGYSSWSEFEATKARPVSEGHMNMFVQAYYNEVAGQAMQDGTLPLPDGSVLVKEAYMTASDAAPMALTIMSKRSGSWYWAQVTPDGDLMLMNGMPLEGRNVEMCIGCHTSAASDNDLVATPYP
jgi:hypothetical protein